MAKLISADLTDNKLCILEYTTTDGKMIPIKPDAFDAEIVSHTYTDIGKIIFQKPITAIRDGVFTRCSDLTSVTIPDSVTTIEKGAFCNCKNLIVFKGKYASDDGRCLIVDGVLNSFAPAKLIEYAIPNCVTTIGDGVFAGCSNLTSVTIPDSVNTIGHSAFAGCKSITSVTIGRSVREIGVETFKNCNIDTIVCCTQVPPKLNNSFGRFENLIIPTGCEDAYANSDWGQYLE